MYIPPFVIGFAVGNLTGMAILVTMALIFSAHDQERRRNGRN